MPQGSPEVKGFDTVLVLDYGAQYGQLIARRVRECRVYSELIPHDASIERIKSYDPKGIILSGGPMSVYVDDAPQREPRALRARRPGARHLLRRPGHRPRARRHGGAHRPQRVRQDHAQRAQAGARPRRHARRRAVLDEPPRQHHRAAARLRGAGGQPRRARGRHGGPRARLLRRAVPPRGRAHAQGHGRPAQLPLQGLRLRPVVHARVHHRGVHPQDPRAGRRLQGDPRPLRRRRLVGRRPAHAPRHRRPPHLRVRRPGHDAHARGRPRGRDLLRHVRHPARLGRRQRPVPRQARGRHRARAQAQDHRRGVHPLLRGGGAQAHRRQVPRPGHALQRRHRERHAAGRQDQEPPQRRRPPREDGLRARRAAALALQGRGPGGRRGAGAAGAHRLAAALPGSRPRHPHHRRDHARARRRAAARRRDRPGGDPQGRALPRALAVLRHPARHPQRRRAGRRAHLRLPHRHPRGHQRRRHDRRLGAPALRPARDARPRASSTRCPRSTASSTTSRASRRAPSSGNDARGGPRSGRRRLVIVRCAAGTPHSSRRAAGRVARPRDPGIIKRCCLVARSSSWRSPGSS